MRAPTTKPGSTTSRMPWKDTHDKAAAVFHGAAVFVGALIRVGAQKLLQQVAVRAVDLHAVGAGGLRIERGLNEETDQAVDILDGHLARQDRVAADHTVELHARRHGLTAAVDRRGASRPPWCSWTKILAP